MIVYIPKENKEHILVLEAFADGVECEVRDVEDYKPSDVAVIFGVGKKNIPVSYPRGYVFNQQRRLGNTTVIVEKGYINRDEYYSVGLNGLNNRADFNNINCKSDRWDDLDIEIPINEGGDYTLLCGQVPHDASVQNIDIMKWCQDIAERIEGQIVFRQHPLVKGGEIEGTIRSEASLEEDLAGAKAVVTFNSNTGVDAALRGIPVYAEDKGSMVYGIASQDIENIGKINTRQWSYDIAYAQWDLEEIGTGLPWEHLNEHCKL